MNGNKSSRFIRNFQKNIVYENINLCDFRYPQKQKHTKNQLNSRKKSPEIFLFPHQKMK